MRERQRLDSEIGGSGGKSRGEKRKGKGGTNFETEEETMIAKKQEQSQMPFETKETTEIIDTKEKKKMAKTKKTVVENEDADAHTL